MKKHFKKVYHKLNEAEDSLSTANESIGVACETGKYAEEELDLYRNLNWKIFDLLQKVKDVNHQIQTKILDK